MEMTLSNKYRPSDNRAPSQRLMSYSISLLGQSCVVPSACHFSARGFLRCFRFLGLKALDPFCMPEWCSQEIFVLDLFKLFYIRQAKSYLLLFKILLQHKKVPWHLVIVSQETEAWCCPSVLFEVTSYGKQVMSQMWGTISSRYNVGFLRGDHKVFPA